MTLLQKARGRYRRYIASLLFKRPFCIATETPLISFSFDDFPRSALLTGGAILKEFGLRGTYYVSLGLMGKREPTGTMYLAEDIALLYESRHELGCHTFHHSDAWNTKPEVFEEGIIKNRIALQELVPMARFRTLSYPINVPRALTKRRASNHFVCCRAGGQTFNVGSTDLSYLSAFFLEKSRDTPWVVKDLIEENRRERGWLIFATHDITANPTPFGCTPTFFREIVRCAVDSGAHILPVAAAWDVLRRGYRDGDRS